MSENAQDNASVQQDSQNVLPPPPPAGQGIAPTGAFPGSLTPGWNDPPPLSSNSPTNAANSRRPRLDLRKRVAYPLDGSMNTAQAADCGGPPSRPVAKISPQRQNPTIDNSSHSNNGNENTLPTRLPPLAPGLADMSKVPIAKILPRQK